MQALFQDLRADEAGPEAVSVGFRPHGAGWVADWWPVGTAPVAVQALAPAIASKVNRAAIEATATKALLLHAGFVSIGGQGVAVVARSGGGKTTLVAELVARGAEYCSDEICAFEWKTGTALPYPKPLTIKAGSADPISGCASSPHGRVVRVGERFPFARVPVPLRSIYLLQRTANARPSRARLRAADAVLALASHVNSLTAHGDRALERMATLATQVPSYALVYSSAGEASRYLLDVAEKDHAGA